MLTKQEIYQAVDYLSALSPEDRDGYVRNDKNNRTVKSSGVYGSHRFAFYEGSKLAGLSDGSCGQNEYVQAIEFLQG